MRRLHYLLPLCLLLASGPALAQQLPAPAEAAGPALAPAPAAPPDTLAALHRLFAHKRQARTRTLLLTALGGGISTAAGLNSGPLPPETNAALGASETLLALLIEVLCYQRYNQRHEQRAAQEFSTRHRLPPTIQKKLHPRYFAPPAS